MSSPLAGLISEIKRDANVVSLYARFDNGPAHCLDAPIVRLSALSCSTQMMNGGHPSHYMPLVTPRAMSDTEPVSLSTMVG